LKRKQIKEELFKKFYELYDERELYPIVYEDKKKKAFLRKKVMNSENSNLPDIFLMEINIPDVTPEELFNILIKPDTE
jgi:hypothetical protein